jgi:hypothetical protein
MEQGGVFGRGYFSGNVQRRRQPYRFSPAERLLHKQSRIDLDQFFRKWATVYQSIATVS